MNGREVAERLAGVERAELGWRELLDELGRLERDGLLDQNAVTGMQARLDDVVAALGDQARRCQEVVGRCLEIEPCASESIPAGF